MIKSCSLRILVCILITLAQPRLQHSTRIVMYVTPKAIDKSRTFKACATVPRSVRPNKLASKANLKMLKEVSETPKCHRLKVKVILAHVL